MNTAIASDTDARTLFTPGEIKRRQLLVTASLDELSCDFALLHSADNAYYASGVPLLSEWGRPLWFALKCSGESAVIGAAIERENMQLCAGLSEVLCYDDSDDVWAASLRAMATFMGPHGVARIGVELELLPARVHNALREAFPGAELVDVAPALFEARIIKSEEELAVLRLGGQVAKIGAGAFLDALTEGVSELSVASHAVFEMERAIAALCPAALSSTYAYCQSGLRTLTPHLHAGGRRIKKGDVVALNVFPVISGYCMELERTFVFGEPTPAQEHALTTATEAFEFAKTLVKPGCPMREIDAAATEVLAAAGYADAVRHGTGHAHGIMIGSASREDLGELRPYNKRALAPGMACSIEPGIYLPEIGGFRHSDVMEITEAGGRCLTVFPVEIALP